MTGRVCVCGHHELHHHAGGCDLGAICGCSIFEPDDGSRVPDSVVTPPIGHTPYEGRYSRAGGAR